MGKISIPSLFAALIMISVVLFSCSSSRYQQGFSYHPAYAGPDVATGQSELQSIEETDKPVTSALENTGQDQWKPEVQQNIQAEALADIIGREYQENQVSDQPQNNKELLRKMANDYAASQNKQLTHKQLRKLDRYAARMDKKQYRGAGDVNWGPANNLEWFILLGAGVALVVGILGIGFGWFIFLGLALVYLYFKLLKNN